VTITEEKAEMILRGLKQDGFLMKKEILRRYGYGCSEPIISRALKLLIGRGEVKRCFHLQDMRQRGFRLVED
jgi:hypothetical protein